MKKVITLVAGLLLIILNNSILNFVDTPFKVDIVFIYIIVGSIFFQDFNIANAIVLGFLMDVTIGRYKGAYLLTYMITSLACDFMKDKIRKENKFLIALIFSAFTILRLGLFILADKKGLSLHYIQSNSVTLIGCFIMYIFLGLLFSWFYTFLKKER